MKIAITQDRPNLQLINNQKEKKLGQTNKTGKAEHRNRKSTPKQTKITQGMKKCTSTDHSKMKFTLYCAFPRKCSQHQEKVQHVHL